MVKCVLKRRDGFVKVISRERVEPYIVMLEAPGIAPYDYDIDGEVTMIDINKIYFRLNRQFTNEYEERVAVYYE